MIGHKNARIRRSGKKKIKIDTNGSEGRCQIRILKIKQMHTINLLTLLCITVVFIYFVISTRHPICCFVSYTLFRFLSFALECFLLFQLLPSGPLSFDRKLLQISSFVNMFVVAPFKKRFRRAVCFNTNPFAI